MKKRIVLLTLCCISLLCIGYPLSKKISSSKDKTVQVSETDNTKTSTVNHTQEDTPKSSVSKDKNTSESTTAPESTDSIDSSETKIYVARIYISNSHVSRISSMCSFPSDIP